MNTHTLIISTFVYLFLSFSNIYAWDDCPHGLVNDPYPGDCGGYVDTNNDKICDHSQPEPESIGSTPTLYTESAEPDHDEEYAVDIEGKEMKTLTIDQIASLWKIDSQELLDEIISEFNLQENYTTNSILDSLRDEYAFSPTLIKQIAENIKNGEVNSASTSKIVSNKSQKKNPYSFVLPILITALVYYLSYQQNKKSNLVKFNFFWNIALIISTIPSIFFGLFLILRYSYPALRTINFDFLYWHVEGSIIFSAISICHIIQHLKVVKAQSKSLNKKK